MKRWMLLCVSLLAVTMTTAAVLQREQALLADKLIRLHVVANSDSTEDQAVKLQVRDAVLQVTEGMEREELEQALPQIRLAAETCLSQLGKAEAVSVTLAEERFPTRVYGRFSLPAGAYHTLRVTIGAGSGKNWWCVAYPSICFCATAEDLEAAAVTAGLSEREVRMITEDGGGYVLKFKVIEWLGELKTALFA